MSKPLASETTEHNKSRDTGGKRGGDDEEKEKQEGVIVISAAENSTTSTVVSTVPAPVDDFIHTIEFRILFAPFVHAQTLMTLRVLNKEWNGMMDVLIDEGVKSGTMMVHDGKNIIWGVAYARKKRRELVTRVIFLLNITKVGENACHHAANLVVVDIPNGVERIGECAFFGCRSLTAVSFPATLKSIGKRGFQECFILDNVDLLHTNLQELGEWVFAHCSELVSVTIPDSLQTLDASIFYECSKLVPFTIDNYWCIDTTSEVVAYLRSKQQQL